MWILYMTGHKVRPLGRRHNECRQSARQNSRNSAWLCWTNSTRKALVVTKHGKPVARVLPYERRFAPLIGSLRDKMEIQGDILATGGALERGC